jgi:hypothetical protein
MARLEIIEDAIGIEYFGNNENSDNQEAPVMDVKQQPHSNKIVTL